MNAIEAIQKAWGWVGIEPEEIVSENDFGNLIIRDVLGRYWRLCPEDVYCIIVAHDQEAFNTLSREQAFLEDWHMSALVETAKDQFGDLLLGRKYHLSIPAVLGGAYDASNIRTVSHIEQILFSGDIGRKIKSLPDGSQIQLTVL
jgi:hypothetical protein